ncbi:MAG TPA: SurA N-terminal domain-containing protein [Aquabacterium sp.]|uniref:peptidylprolyl isomerase n=1 Tax=Aquabacterium sp. TaxID=1872578 RepID=UPI002E342926|nr:SurA N-terminal domain-containing protein [Aquabacterium sp.]HEX5358006.1 SurA N-terminal domain-containing protein [Aquabacterium sp.]
MFDFVRKHTRILQLLLILLILPSFVVFGIQGYSSFASNEGVVAKVGSQKIMQTEWDNANRNVAENYRAQQPGIDAKLFDTPEFKSKSLDSLVRQSVLATAAYDQHLSVPVSRLTRAFLTDPRFASLRNPDGSLNKQLLEAQGMTPARLEALLRQELTLAQVLGGVQATGQTSKLATRAALEAMFQVRDVQWMKIEPKSFAAQLNPTAEQLQAFYKDPANASWLTAPEKADVQYLVLDVDALKKRVTVNEDDLRRSYKENEKRFTVPEERRARHILIEVKKTASADEKKAARAKADQLLAQLRKNPSQFAELAKKNSDDPGSASNGGDLDFFGRGAMTKAFEDAAFALKPGQLSDVVESDYGFHIILLTEVRGGQVQPYEAVKAQLEDDARKQLAQREFAGVAEKFTNGVYEQSDSLKPIADELKLEVQTATDVLREPGAKDQGVLSNRRVLDALFDPANRAKGRNTEAIEVGPSKLVSARIVKYSPATRQPFETVQAQVRERWIAAEALKAARKDAEQKMALWKQSPDKSQMPAAVQMSGKTIYNQPPIVLESALRIPEKQLPAWTVVDLGAEGVALLKVNKVLPMQISDQELNEAQSQYGSYWGKAEADAYYRALKRQYKVQFLNEGKKTMDKVTESQKTSAAQ